MALFQGIGNLFNSAGTALNLPELGISERFGVTGGNAPMSTAPINKPVYSQPQSGQIMQSKPFIGPKQQVLAWSAAAPSGGGGQMQQPQGNQGFPLESVPAFEEPQYDIGPQLAELETQSRLANDSFAQNVGLIEQNLQAGLGEQEGARANIKTEAGRAISEQEQMTKMEQGDIARTGSELMQGLQARFGSAVSTGRDAGELMMREVLRARSEADFLKNKNINQINTLAEQKNMAIDQAINSLKLSTEASKAQARTDLNEALSRISMARSEVGSRKQDMVFRAMEQYRSQLFEANARNTSFLQDLEMQRQRNTTSAANAKSSYLEDYQKLALSSVSNLAELVAKKILTPQEAGNIARNAYEPFSGTQLQTGQQSNDTAVFSGQQTQTTSTSLQDKARNAALGGGG